MVPPSWCASPRRSLRSPDRFGQTDRRPQGREGISAKRNEADSGGETELDRLFAAGLGGDDAAYGAFLEGVAETLRPFARRRFGAVPGADPEDLVQEILLAVHVKRHTWRRGEPVRPWLFAIAKHKAVDGWRRNVRHGAQDIEAVAAGLSQPEAEMRPSHRDIERAVGSLTDRQRDVVNALSVDGRSIAETSKQLRMSEGAVRVAFHRGLAAIAARFGKD